MPTVISLVSYPFLPAKLGGQKGIALFNKYFATHHRLICVATRQNDPGAAEGYLLMNVLPNSRLRYINIFLYFTMRRIIKNNGATHLLLEHPYFGWLGLLLKWTCRVKLIVHSHNLEGLRWMTLGKWWWPLLWVYERAVHRQADFNFFIHDEDTEYGIRHFGLQAGKCLTMTYGIERRQAPVADEIQNAREYLRKTYGIGDKTKILLFNGAFGYAPNLEALRHITDHIEPLLRSPAGFDYNIIICGKDIPRSLSLDPGEHMIYAGFVDDISVYFMGADLFLNPLTQGGGIKTKLVEALGNNLTAVSTTNGATGIDPALCNGKLLVCKDYDWESFAGLVREAVQIRADTGPAFYEKFYWGYSTRRAAEFIGVD